MCEPGIRPIYLSPHLDDAALSCGGLIHQQAQQGMRPVVITCFAGAPDYTALSPFAAEQHHSWGQPSDPIGQRRREDASAMTCLGAEYEHWSYPDCIYRHHATSGELLYASEAAIFGELHHQDQGLRDELVARLRVSFPSAGVRFYSPLTVGHHVDHQLVFQASVQLHQHGYSVQYYEDYPYAQSSTNLSEALSSWAVPPVSMVQMLDGKDLQAKISAIGLYASQLGVLFGDEASMVAKVTSYALTVGAGQGYGERYWQEGHEA
jgi:LmbE family N-acetylglucosaminyl deacetylase